MTMELLTAHPQSALRISNQDLDETNMAITMDAAYDPITRSKMAILNQVFRTDFR